ncbi:hypothetical protein L0152_25855, partial [bacterium]|nr:hypothetical protein [bacterium]
MKIANNYFQDVKTKLEEAIQERLPEQTSESKTTSTTQTTTQTTVSSQSAKLKSAAEESLSRIRIENEIGQNIDANKLGNMKNV